MGIAKFFRKAFSDDYKVYNYSILKKKPTTYLKHTDAVTKFYISDLFEPEPIIVQRQESCSS